MEDMEKYRVIAIGTALLFLSVMLSPGLGFASEGSVDSASSAAPNVTWGPVSHNLQMSISLPKSTIKLGEPILVNVKIEDLGPPLIIARDGHASQYKAIFVSAQPGASPAPKLQDYPRSFDVWYQFWALYTGTTYAATVDFTDMYDIGIGTYKLTLESSIFPTSMTAETPVRKTPITTLTSNTVQLTVVK
jgi:hypothetical protein